MNTKFDELAKGIFDLETQHPDCPAAAWNEQPDVLKNKYRVAAMTVRLITLGPIYDMRMPTPVAA